MWAIKESDVSTKLKEEVFSEAGNSCIHRCKSKINIDIIASLIEFCIFIVRVVVLAGVRRIVLVTIAVVIAFLAFLVCIDAGNGAKSPPVLMLSGNTGNVWGHVS